MSIILEKLEDIRNYLDVEVHPVVSPDRWDVYAALCDMVDDTIALLKAQKPVSPIVDVDEWKCGCCGHKLEHQELLGDNVLFHEQYDFCPGCGKKVKWE